MPTGWAALSPADARSRFRAGLVRPTSGVSAGFAQANLVIVPRSHAFDLLLFAQRNPKPMPLLGVLDAGQVTSELPASQVADAVRITSRYPAVHGAPVQVGAPGEIGIADLSRPDFGDPVQIPDGHLPVFWACSACSALSVTSG